MILFSCSEARACRHIVCVCDDDPTLLDNDTFGAAADLRRLSIIRTQGNPYPIGSAQFEAFELCRRPAFS